MEGIKIDIIFLSYAKNFHLENLTRQALKTLHDSEDPTQVEFNIVVLESNNNVKPYQFPRTQTIYPKDEFGYNKFMNLGIKSTSNKYICLCNNDLIFHKNWATEILNAFNLNLDLKSASPICSFHQPKRGIQPFTGILFGYDIFRELSGWCIFFHREILKDIGMFDEKLKFWYVDNDYANILIKKNIKHALITSSLVDHLGDQTISNEDDTRKTKLTTDEFLYYDFKWNHKNYIRYLYRQMKRTIKKNLNI